MRYFLLLFVLTIGVAYSQEPPQIPRSDSEQKSNNAPQSENNTQPHTANSQILSATITPPDTGKPSDHTYESGEKGTELWPPFFGYRLKVTDTLLVVFTGLLFIATLFLYCATRDLVRGAEDTARRRSRAYVSLREFQPISITNATGEVHTWRFRPMWENSGQTFTQRMFNHVSWRRYPTGHAPDDDGFPDLWAPGIPQQNQRNVPLIAGPRTKVGGQGADIPVTDILTATQNHDQIFIWGWAEYDDVFAPKTPRRRTEFCITLGFTGNPTQPNNCLWNFTMHMTHNGADNETTRQSTPR